MGMRGGPGARNAISRRRFGRRFPLRPGASVVWSRPDAMSLDNGLVNLAAIVSTIILLCGTIPLLLILSTPKKGRGDKHG